MTITITRDFAPADRYRYDFGACTYKRGWAQIDTWQDASYFGIWTQPWERKILTYCEGDVTLQAAETDEEYARIVRECVAFYRGADGDQMCAIDPGFGERFKDRFAELGLTDFFH